MMMNKTPNLMRRCPEIAAGTCQLKLITRTLGAMKKSDFAAFSAREKIKTFEVYCPLHGRAVDRDTEDYYGSSLAMICSSSTEPPSSSHQLLTSIECVRQTEMDSF